MESATQNVIRHRCGTCGAIFRSIQELTTHVTKRHVEHPRGNDDGWNTTRLPQIRVAQRGWLGHNSNTP